MTKSAEIIAVGTELLLGEIVNTDGAFISRKLAEIGINVYYQTTVGDNPARLASALAIAAERSDIIITTGGLGPTYDDLTKETIAAAFSRKLVRDSESEEYIRDFFAKRGKVMTENNLKQADAPERSTIFKNYWGTAPAYAFEEGKNTVIMLPGPPNECNPLTERYVIPYLMKYSDGVLTSEYIRVRGIGESEVENILHELMLSSLNPTVAPYAKSGSVLLRVTAKAPTEQEGRTLCRPVCENILSLLGPHAYDESEGKLEGVVSKLLREKGKTLSTAESCTGGLVAKLITDLPGASDIFPGGLCSYANEIKENILGVPSNVIDEYGAVSPECAREMAQNVRIKFSTDYGIGITGIAGPGGGSDRKPVGLVYIALADAEGCEVSRNLFGEAQSREKIRNDAANRALDMLRRKLL